LSCEKVLLVSTFRRSNSLQQAVLVHTIAGAERQLREVIDRSKDVIAK
jgi:hypothetical protein